MNGRFFIVKYRRLRLELKSIDVIELSTKENSSNRMLGHIINNLLNITKSIDPILKTSIDGIDVNIVCKLKFGIEQYLNRRLGFDRIQLIADESFVFSIK